MSSVITPNKVTFDKYANESMLTVVSKWMGDTKRWKKFLINAAESGFTMIHWTPLQERGSSNSPYSIKNQLAFDPSIDVNELKEMLEWSRKELGLKHIIDVVWNHTSCDSEWLDLHPESAYNTENSPHLLKAFELDEAIREFSQMGRSVDSIDEMMRDFKAHLDTKRLWEYFVIDVNEALEEFKKATFSNKEKDSLDLSAYLVTSQTNSRFIRKLCKYDEIATNYKNFDDPLGSFKKDLEFLNLRFYHEYDHHIECILRNLRNNLYFERHAHDGPRLGPICASAPFAPPYFTKRGKNVLANNGWMFGEVKVDNNFASECSEAYFRREIMVWSDCVKLNYDDENSWIWKHMTKYTCMMAGLFDGFRIDNCHSTPLKVAKKLLDEARKVNPSLYICAELFTNDHFTDMKYVQALGIDALIRETARIHNSRHFANTLRGTSHNQSPKIILFDCTHDNEMPAQRGPIENILPLMALTACSSSGIGSVLGHDLILARKNCIVTERRIMTEAHGILAPLRKLLNQIHFENNVYTDLSVEEHGPLVIVRRTDPHSGSHYIIVTRTAFDHNESHHFHHELELQPSIKILFKAFLRIHGMKMNNKFIQSDFDAELVELPDTNVIGDRVSLRCDNFPPGAVMIFEKKNVIPANLLEILEWNDKNSLTFC